MASNEMTSYTRPYNQGTSLVSVQDGHLTSMHDTCTHASKYTRSHKILVHIEQAYLIMWEFVHLLYTSGCVIVFQNDLQPCIFIVLISPLVLVTILDLSITAYWNKHSLCRIKANKQLILSNNYLSVHDYAPWTWAVGHALSICCLWALFLVYHQWWHFLIALALLLPWFLLGGWLLCLPHFCWLSRVQWSKRKTFFFINAKEWKAFLDNAE